MSHMHTQWIALYSLKIISVSIKIKISDSMDRLTIIMLTEVSDMWRYKYCMDLLICGIFYYIFMCIHVCVCVCE